MSIPIQIVLIDAPLKKMLEVSAVGNQSKDLLEILKHKKISIGTRIEIKKKFSFDHTLELTIKNKSATDSHRNIISEQLAKSLFVKLI